MNWKIFKNIIEKIGISLGLGVCLLIPVSLPAEQFPPYQKYEGPIKPGIEITKENLPQYLDEFKKLIQSTREYWFIELGLKKGLFTVPIQEIEFFPPSPGFVAATEKNRGKCKIGADGELMDWEAGTPFPEAKTAEEIAWNCYPEVSHATSHDDLDFKATYNFYNYKGNYEKHFSWILYKKKYRGRTDIPPCPFLPEAVSDGVLSKEAIVITEPFDVKGFVQIRIRYWDMKKADEVYAYLPALRRVRRLTGSDVCDPILGSDMPYDDYETWRQKLTPEMKFNLLGKKDFIVPATYAKMPKDLHKGVGLQLNWEIRPLHMLEVIVNNPDYMYSRRILYIDATPEGNWTIYWGENYDQAGRLWRALGVTPIAHETWEGKSGFRNLYGFVITNVLNNHFSNPVGDPKFYSLDPIKAFSIKEVLKGSR